MAAKGKRPGARYSREQRQEDRSEGQIKERFAELGWPCDRLGRDLGEDLSVRIYDEGASSGLTFLVQLKSVADAEKRKRKKIPALGYDLEVKDLLHWEVSTTLVVLVVWDVAERRGWWRPIAEIIRELDAANKGWRKRKKVAVSVPLANGTDDEGLRRLRWAVADHSLPIVPKPERSELTLCFPKTADGRASLAALRRAFDEDESVSILVPKIQHPAWHRRVYGDFDGPARISIGRSEASFVVPVRVDLESSLGTASLAYVELRPRAWGTQKKVLSNEQQGLPIELSIEMAEDRFEPRLKVTRFRGFVEEVREAAKFALVMAGESAHVRLTHLTGPRQTLAFDLEGSTEKATVEALQQWNALIDRLAFVQERLPSQRIIIPDAGVSHAEAAMVDRAFAILSRGEEPDSIPLSLTVAPGTRPPGQRELRDGAAVVSIGTGEGAPIHIFNAVFEPGVARVILKDPAAFFAECERQTHASEGGRVLLEKVPVIYEYPKWMPEQARWERLAQLSISQDGYVTISQARWVGYSDDVFLALLAEHKIEPIASDVFRLLHFPRSDHEELVALWLQTDRKGVLSHDTAMLLHELSDILPTRRHITVPVGWSPPEGRILDPDVVLHRGEVPEDDLCWIGPVPFTAPLRTLRDAIAVSVSPDLIEQAIAGGLRRGMFRATDLPPGALPGAA